MQAHSHAHHELLLVAAGTIEVEMRGARYQATCGELLHYPAGVKHAEASDRRHPCETYFIGFEWPACPSDLALQQSDSLGRIGHWLRWLFEEREAHPTTLRTLQQAGLHAVLIEYLRLTAAEPQSLVADLRAFMRKHLTKRLTLAELAAHAGMSKYHFVRLYRQLSGHTPIKDLRRLQLEAARDLLLTTHLPLKDIAPKVGLADEYHLSHLFRRHFQMAPGRLRQKRARV